MTEPAEHPEGQEAGPAAESAGHCSQVDVEPPGPRARELIERDRAVASDSYTKPYPLVVARARGATVEDVDGNRFLDFMAGIGVASTGHAHPRVVDAIQRAARELLHICGSDFYYERMTELCQRLDELAPGTSPKKVFLTNSGAEAVEGAIKLSRHATGRSAIVAFDGAFHGRTFGAMSLTSSKAKQRKGFGPMLPEVYHVPYAYCRRCAYGKSYPDCDLYCVSAIERRLFDRRVDPEDVAAVFVEPVLGEGGCVVPPPDYLLALRELCDRHGILLVVDEVQTGIGRTGRMFAAEHAGVEPDVLLTAKGLGSGMPIGGIVTREYVESWESGSHGSTFGGNPVCCAAALATLDLVEESLAENAAQIGEYLLSGAEDLARRYQAIQDVRGMGLMVGLELAAAKREDSGPALAEAVVQHAFRKGLLLLGAGESTIRLLPPLVIDREAVDAGLQILDDALAEVA